MSFQRKEKQLKKKIASKWDIYAYTVISCLNQAAFGLSSSSVGPAYVDLKYILDTSMNWISLVSTFVAFGYVIGSLCGFLYKYINRQIATIIELLLMCSAIILLPYADQLWNLYLCTWIYGFGCGAWNIALNVWLIEMWQKNSAPVLQLAQFMFGIGTIFGPLIDKPFLTGEHVSIANVTDVSNSSVLPAVNTSLMYENINRRSKLKIPFLIIGIAQIIGPILMTIMFIVKKYRTPTKTNTENNRNRAKLFDIENSPRTLVIILTSILLAFSCGSEGILLQFGATYYQYIPLKLTASKSAELVSAMALTYTIGRGISVLIAMKVKPQHMIVYQYSILFMAMSILLFGQNSLTLIWIGSLTLSYGYSSLFPSIIAFTSQYLDMTDRIGAVLIFFSSFVNIISPFILGAFIDSHPIIYILSMVTTILMSISLFVAILLVIRSTEKNVANLISNDINDNEVKLKVSLNTELII